MTRTAQRAYLLEDPILKKRLVSMFDAFSRIYYVNILAWTVMDNHYHLCLEVLKPGYDEQDVRHRFELLQEQNRHRREWSGVVGERVYRRFSDLSWFMWEINRRIAIVHNREKGTDGHFWGARFKSKVLEDSDALLNVSAYIEQNPVRAGLADRPSEYEHCSAGRLFREIEARMDVSVTGIGFLERIEGQQRALAYILYMDYLSELLTTPEKKTLEPPDEIKALTCTTEWGGILQELKEGRASDWRLTGYHHPHQLGKMERGP